MKILKKHKYKLLTLMLSIVSIFTLFLGINKTYAYETDTFTYTIDTITLNSNSPSIFSYDSENHIIKRNGTSSSQVILNINLPQQIDVNKCYLLINADIEVSNDDIDYSVYYNNTTQYASVYRSSTNNGSNYMLQYGTFKFTSGIKNNNMYTIIAQPNIYTTQTNLSTIYLWLSCFNGISQQYAKFTIKNIDYVMNTDIGLSQYYETYYSQIEDNYNALLSDYNDLQDSYDTLEGNYNTLNNDYQDLENNYNTLQTNYTNLQQEIDSIYNLGSLYFVQYVFIQTNQNNQNYTKSWTQSELINGNYYNGIHLKIGNLIDYIKRQNNLSLTEDYKIIIQFNKSLLIDNFDIIMATTNYADLQSVDVAIYNANPMESDNTPSFTINIPFNQTTLEINKDIISQNTSHELDNKYINRLNFTYNNIRDTYNLNISSNIEIDQTQYNLGFNNGQVNARNEYLPIIRELEQQEVEKTNTINNLNTQLETLQAQYEDLNDRYNRVSNPNNTLYSMVVSIADVPLHVFKQIFNFDILGINISTFVLSLISLLIIIWLIKKII